MTDELLDTWLGQYHLIELIQRGGMAAIYKAHQPSLDRFVAIKVMLNNRDPQFPARFKREARAIAQLQHPNILPIFDYGEQDGMLYLVLQYVENGTTLTHRMGAPMQPESALRLISRLLDGLEYAHSRGIIHRDIKPGNVLLPSPDWPMLADFGIAKLLNDNNQAQLTVPGLVVGTAAYMAPEQALAHPVDARTDLYAIGVILYEMFTGRVPFDAELPVVVLTQHVYEPPTPPARLNPTISPDVEQVILRALAKKPDERYQSAPEMAAALNTAATQLAQNDTHGQLTRFYQVGVLAFEEGRWDQAVEQFEKLVALDPDYEDGADLLNAAQEARTRTRADARRQIDQVRQRRTTMPQAEPAQPAPATGATSQLAAVPAISNTAHLDQPHQDTIPPELTPQAVIGATNPVVPIAEPASPQPANLRKLALVGAIIALIILVAGVSFAASLWPGTQATATSAPTVLPVKQEFTPEPQLQPTRAAPTRAPQQPSSTPAQPVAALPAPAGVPVLEEDFGSGGDRTGLEDRVQDPEFSRGFHPPGVYHFLATRPDEIGWVVMPRRTYGDFTLQIDAWDNSDDFVGGVAQGIIFRARDLQHFYAFLIDPRAGRYTIRKYTASDAWSDLVPWKDSSLLKHGADINAIRIDASGATFTIYLNQQQAESFNDPEYAHGMLGMMIANGDANKPHMHFDNLEIWNNDPPPQVSAQAQNRDTPTGQMVLIPAGEFVMGVNGRNDSMPHIVDLPDFYIDQTEVTNAAYANCIAENACSPQLLPSSQTHPNYATQEAFTAYPVLHATWTQANQYCQWAGKRLPTEAEWEKAASWNTATRSKQIWAFGDQFNPTLLTSAESNPGDTIAVQQHEAELNGTYDIAGNLSEWTSSLYRPYPYDATDGREDLQAAGERVFRGGSWAQTQGKARSTLRQSAAPDYADREIGFRCAAAP